MSTALVSLGNDITLHVRQEGAGLPLLLVHGFPLDHQMWNEQFATLSRSFRLIAPDLRGFGKSTVTAGTMQMADYADDLAKLLDALAVHEPIVLCGLSMGGYVALQFVQKHRQRLRGLVLCDSRAAADTSEAAANRLKQADRVLLEGSDFLAEAMIPKLFSGNTQSEHPDVVEATRKIILGTNRQVIAAALRGMAERPDSTPNLPGIELPALLLCGSDDAITPAKEMAAVAADLPQGKFVEIAGAGHMSPLEAPAAVNAALTEFLGSL